MAALAATLAQYAGRLGEGAEPGRAPNGGARLRRRPRWCSPAPAAPTGSRSRPAGRATSAPCSTTCGSTARRWPASCEPLMRWAVLLAGGSGTRFWPLSTPENPKQLLPLAGPSSSAEDAVERLAGLIPRERILVVAGAGLAARAPGAAQASAPRTCWSSRARPPRRRRSSGPPGRRSAAIPRPRCSRSTPTGRWATPPRSGSTADIALATARRHDRLVTVGMVPSRPETGYGYIVPGAPLDERRAASPGSPRSPTPPPRST